MKSICALIEDWVTDDKSLWDRGNEAIVNTGKKVINTLYPDPVGTSIESMKDIGTGTAKLAGKVVSGLGSATHSLASTAPVRNVLIAGAGLGAARYLGQKWTERKNSNTQKPKYHDVPKFESINISEQNENLPRFPQLSYTNKIPRSPRSVASFFMRRKPATYSVNAGDQSVEAHRKISARFVKRSAADTGVDRVVGKLVA